jgi:hypothetical protein
MDDELLGQLIALGFIVAVIALLFLLGRRVAVATQTVTYEVGDEQRTVVAGSVIPANDVAKAGASVKSVRRSWFTAIVVGKDNRTSTSKSVAFAWTLAIVWALVALLAAKWLGYDTGWQALLDEELPEEYLLFLGGPYAAAIIAKARAVSNANSGSPSGTPGESTPGQLVTDDAGDADLVDFQYVLFNLIALAYFLGEFISNLENAFPDMPDVLAGLALTSAGAYSAKKLVGQLKPTLTSVLPATAAGGATIKVYGTNLIIPAELSPTGEPLAPSVAVAGKAATVSGHQQILGADVLTLAVPTGLTAGAGTIVVVRADGAAAVGPAGSDGIAFTVAGAATP